MTNDVVARRVAEALFRNMNHDALDEITRVIADRVKHLPFEEQKVLVERLGLEVARCIVRGETKKETILTKIFAQVSIPEQS